MEKDDYEANLGALEFLIKKGTKSSKIAAELDISIDTALRWIRKYNKKEKAEDHITTTKELVKVDRQKQKLQDQNRYLRKQVRETARLDNAVSEYTKGLTKVLSENKFHKFTLKHNKRRKSGTTAVIQLSDIHFNEIVDMPNNKYDFMIASIRLRKYATEAKKYFKAHKVDKVVIAMTGDLMNSDRRLDELMCAATNRSRATFLSVDILQQFIVDINQDYNVEVAYVTGNEGRVNQEMGWGDVIATDNFDTTIFEMLKFLFLNTKGIKFLGGNPCEKIVNCSGQNLLMIHGHGGMRGKLCNAVTQIMGRYSSMNQKVDYVIFGHIHEAYISDMFGRSASLVGQNAYSDRALNLTGRASQNIYFFHSDGTRDGIKIDLQVTEGEAYNIDRSLEEYNPRGVNKSNTIVIQKILI